MPDRAGAGLVPLVPGLLGRQANHSGPSLSIPRIERHESCQSLPAISTRPSAAKTPSDIIYTTISTTAIFRLSEVLIGSTQALHLFYSYDRPRAPQNTEPQPRNPQQNSKRARTIATTKRAITILGNNRQSIKLLHPSVMNCAI